MSIPEIKAPAGYDPFDPANCRQSVAAYQLSMPSKKLLIRVPVKKPGKQEWFQVHPEEAFRTPTAIFVDENDKDTPYLVVPHMREALGSDARDVELLTCINRQGDVFLWPLTLVGPDGRGTSWASSAGTIAQQATGNWVRMTANMTAGHYEVHGLPAESGTIEPQWPAEDFTLARLLRIAFEGRIIDSVTHPALRKLWGYA